MKNTFGTSIRLTLFGESHGPGIGAVLDGLAPGIPVHEEHIAGRLRLRRPAGDLSTARREEDPFRIVSGVFEGRTTGSPLAILIPNGDTRSGDYKKGPARPSHADFTAAMKYHGFEDYRGGGHFSGRITAALVAAGSILLDALEGRGILIGTHIARAAGISDLSFSEIGTDSLREAVSRLNALPFPVLDEGAGERMKAAIREAREAGDSVGGVLETVVLGVPAGVGEPWFDSMEGVLSHALFSVPAVKGVEFGDGFRLCDMRGSEANDALLPSPDCSLSGVRTRTNHGGGIAGGIANGMPVVFRCAVKPTPSIAKEQDTINLLTGEAEVLSVRGRHDPFIAHRARAAVDAVTALALSDLLALRFGTDWLRGEGAAE